MVEDCVMINEFVWEYFSGKGGSKSEYFRENTWPIIVLFSILIAGALCNVFLVSVLANHSSKNFFYLLNTLYKYVAYIDFFTNRFGL